MELAKLREQARLVFGDPSWADSHTHARCGLCGELFARSGSNYFGNLLLHLRTRQHHNDAAKLLIERWHGRKHELPELTQQQRELFIHHTTAPQTAASPEPRGCDLHENTEAARRELGERGEEEGGNKNVEELDNEYQS